MQKFDYHFNISAGKRIPGMMDIIKKISKEEMPSDEAFLEQLENLSFEDPSKLKVGMRNVNVRGRVFDMKHSKVNIHGVTIDGIKVFIGKPESPVVVEFSEDAEDIIKEGSELQLAFGNIKSGKFEKTDVLLYDEGPYTYGVVRLEGAPTVLKSNFDPLHHLKYKKIKEIEEEKQCMIAELHCPQGGEASLTLSKMAKKGKACKISLFGFGGGCSLELGWDFSKKIDIEKCVEIRRGFKFRTEIGELYWDRKKLTNFFTVDVKDVKPIKQINYNIKSNKDVCKTNKKVNSIEDIEISSGIKTYLISQSLSKGKITELNFKTPFQEILPFSEVSLTGRIEVLETLKFDYSLKKPGRYLMFEHPNCLGFCWKFAPSS